jgi:hypothetical protein
VRVALPAITLVVLVAPFGADSDAGPRKGKAGKVVRVERPRLGARGFPRICQIGGTTGNLSTAICYGAPKVDDIGSLLDGEGVNNTVKVIKVDGDPKQCLNVEVTLESAGAKDRRDRSWSTIVVFDIPLDLKARRLDESAQRSPSGKPNEQSWQVLDADGDGAPDHVLTVYPCDGGAMSPMSELCFDYWRYETKTDQTSGKRTEWAKLRQDRGALCRP